MLTTFKNIKDKIESNRASKNIFWKTCIFFKDFLWLVWQRIMEFKRFMKLKRLKCFIFSKPVYLDKNGKNILLVPPAMEWPGSIGDQAIILSMKNALADCNIFVSVYDTFDNKWDFLEKAGIKKIQFGRLNKLKGFAKVYILGTDAIDGISGTHDYKDFFKVADMAEKLGIPFVFVGFSFSKKPAKGAVKKFQEHKTKYFLRDQSSLERFVLRTGCEGEIAADPAFALPPRKPESDVLNWIDGEQKKGNKILGLNLNFGMRDQEIVDIALRIITSRNDMSVILVSHDYREHAKDSYLMDRVYKSLLPKERSRVYKLEPLAADEIKYVCSRMDTVITGRMHFAIACFGAKTPCIGIEQYNDKMYGVFRFFELEKFLVYPKNIEKIEILLAELLDKNEDARKNILEKLPEILKLSEKNIQ